MTAIAVSMCMLVGMGSVAQAQGAEEAANAGWVQVIDSEEDGGSQLFLGRLGGASSSPMKAETAIWVDGPVGGNVIAWWDDEAGTRVVQTHVDQPDATRDLFLPQGSRLFDAAVSPFLDPPTWYFVTNPEEGVAGGLWQAPLGEGEPKQLTDGWVADSAYLEWNRDGTQLAIWGRVGEGVELRVWDVKSQTLSVVPSEPHGDLVGWLDGALIVYDDPEGDRELHFPLDAIDPLKGTAEPFLEGAPGTFAEVFRGLEGDIVVTDGPGEDGGYTLTARGNSGSGASGEPFFRIDAPWDDSPIGMVRHTHTGDLELPPGWVAVFPRQMANPPAGDQPGMLVDALTGELLTCGPDGCVP